MAKYKVGDTVRIRSREWVDAQVKDAGDKVRIRSRVKDAGGNIPIGEVFVERMFVYAGRTAQITEVNDNGYYYLDITGIIWRWEDWMFDDPADLSGVDENTRSRM
jgi:hypothetical protein